MAESMIFEARQREKDRQANIAHSRGEKTRRVIVARALKIAAREGLDALTIGRLAKELGISKSGLFAHFRSKQALELATLENAREVFADAVLRPAQVGSGGMEKVWNLCDGWLHHIEQRVFQGAYFFTGAFFEYADRPGPIGRAITQTAQEWCRTLVRAVQEAQEHGEIVRNAEPKQVARELNGTLLGANWAYLLEGGNCCREARILLLSKLRKLATDEVPDDAFDSVKDWKTYLKKKH